MKPLLSIFTGNEHLGNVFKEQIQLVNKFLEVNIPLTGSTGRASFNFGGKTRLIVLQGSTSGDGFIGASPDIKIEAFIETVNNWVNTGIQTKRQYTDSFGTIYNIDCIDFTWTRSNMDQSRILYSFIFKEA
jgi:hypothetical protein